ncbi:MAG: hypothetical protein IPL52_15670, partial [Flavobacteriales bacterium]|nr:hypothetical protein [Flavobacteriales bacterium]
MKLVEANDPRTVNDWMRLPWSIYGNDANWIPHLKQDVEKVFDPEKNKLLKPDKETGKVGSAMRWVVC